MLHVFIVMLVLYLEIMKNTTTIKNFEKVNIGLMPIMVKSKLCILNGLDSIRLSELSESSL